MNAITSKSLVTALLLGAALQGASGALAENVHLGKSVPTTEEVIELLMPSDGNYKVRGLRLQEETSPSAAAEAEVAATAVAQPVSDEPRSISLEVYFEFDSAVLSQEAIEQLSPVGAALVSEQLDGLSFELEGHTDAVGGEQYNQGLSERRAEAVRTFFVEQYGIDGTRLDPVGRGEADLLDVENPASGVNRRVTIVAY